MVATMALLLILLTAIFVACYAGTTVLDEIAEMKEHGFLDEDQVFFLTKDYPADLGAMMPRYQISPQLNERLMQYLDTQVHEGALSEARRYYLSTLLHLRNNTDRLPLLTQRSADLSSVPASYTGNGKVEILGRYKVEEPRSTPFYFGVSGYASNDREYALLTDRDGLHIVDITDSSNPVLVQFIEMESIKFWRDVETWKHSNGTTYAYVAGQSGANLYVVDLSGLDTNNTASYIERGWQNYGHTVTVREGYLILNTATSWDGCHIFDLESNPWDPPHVGIYRSGGDCHDSSIERLVVDGEERLVLIAAGGKTGIWTLVDLESTKFDPQSTQKLDHLYVIGETSTEPFDSFAYAHSHTLDASKNLLYVFEESNVYDIAIWDISNPKSPVFLREFSYSKNHVENSLVHNGFIRGDHLLVANYRGGFRVFDVSKSPTTILEVGQYDTFVNPELVEWPYEGAWNLYPGLSSNKVLVTDTKSGLHIFNIREQDVSSTAPTLSVSSSLSPSNAPSTKPTVPVSPTFCDDTRGKFINPQTNKQEPCRWLQARPELISILCYESTETRQVCPETCGVCSDYCEDNFGGSFLDDDGIERNCLWLQGRERLFPTLCAPDNPAAYVCPETCDICDGKGVPPTTKPVQSSLIPSNTPSLRPSRFSSQNPSDLPSNRPSYVSPEPSYIPSGPPSSRPSDSPSFRPSKSPSTEPSLQESNLVFTNVTERDPACISGNMMVELFPGHVFKQVKDLRKGDMVRVFTITNSFLNRHNHQFEPILAFGHNDPDIIARYIRVSLHDKTVLEISQDHLIFIAAPKQNAPVPASNLRVGHFLQDGRRIDKLDYVMRHGAYAPFTASGRLLVNGISISNYITLQSNQTYVQVWGRSTGWSFHFLAHAMVTLPLQLSTTFCPTIGELFLQNSAYEFVKQYWLDQSPWIVTMMFFILILPASLVLYILGQIIMSVVSISFLQIVLVVLFLSVVLF